MAIAQNVTLERLIEFAKAEARMQKRLRLGYQRDSTVTAAIQGWLNCRSLFFGPQTVTGTDMNAAIFAYRRERRLVPRDDRSQQSLLIVGKRASITTTAA